MPRDPRTYITVTHDMPDHPKIEQLSDAAFRLLVTSWVWCDKHKTDGLIATPIWSKRGNARTRAELIEAGLVELQDGSIVMHDYLEHQRSADEIAGLHVSRVAAGAAGGRAKASKALASAKQVASKPLASAVANGKQPPSKSVAALERSSRTLTAAPSDVTKIPTDVQLIVAAYVEGAAKAGRPVPEQSLCARVGKQARAMLARHGASALVEAARSVGQAGWTDLAVQLQRGPAQPALAAGQLGTWDV